MHAKRLASFVVSVLSLEIWSPVLMAQLYQSTGASGSVAYGYRQAANTLGTKDLQHLMTTNLGNRFYLLEDWIARGEMNLSFTKSITETQSGGHEADSVTGQIGLYVLPQSHVPFSVNYVRSDSRVDRDIIVNNLDYSLTDSVVSQSLNLQQNLIGQSYRAQVNYLTSQQTSNQRGDFGLESYGGNFIWRQKGQDAALDFTHKDEILYLGGERTGYNMSFRHGYYANPRVTLSTYASINENEHIMQPDSLGEVAQFNSTMSQVNGNLTWRSTDSKTSVNTSLRYYGVDLLSSTYVESGNTSDSLTGSVALMHRFTPNLYSSLSVMRGVSASQNNNETKILSYSNDKASVRYRSNRIDLSQYIYSWQASVDLRQRFDDSTSEVDAGTSFGHDVFRDWRIGRRNRIHVKASQDIAVNSIYREDAEEISQQRLGHRFGVGWNQFLEMGSKTLLLSLSDSRYLAQSNVMQILTLDYAQQQTLSHRMTMQVTASHQLTLYEYGETQANSEAVSSSVLMVFSYMGVWSIPNLMFNTDLKFVESKANTQNDISNEMLWRNNLSYRIGKIESSLQYVNREARGVGYESLYFNVKRIF